MKLDNKVALITGAGSGIGEAIASYSAGKAHALSVPILMLQLSTE